MREHSGQALPGSPNGLADLEAAGGPVASQGLTHHPAAPVPYGQRFLCPVLNGEVALCTSLPGISRRAASILWSGAVTPPPSSTEHTFFYHAIPHVRKCNLNAEQ